MKDQNEKKNKIFFFKNEKKWNGDQSEKKVFLDKGKTKKIYIQYIFKDEKKKIKRNEKKKI